MCVLQGAMLSRCEPSTVHGCSVCSLPWGLKAPISAWGTSSCGLGIGEAESEGRGWDGRQNSRKRRRDPEAWILRNVKVKDSKVLRVKKPFSFGWYGKHLALVAKGQSKTARLCLAHCCRGLLIYLLDCQEALEVCKILWEWYRDSVCQPLQDRGGSRTEFKMLLVKFRHFPFAQSNRGWQLPDRMI